jgi:hypothetical protein
MPAAKLVVALLAVGVVAACAAPDIDPTPSVPRVSPAPATSTPAAAPTGQSSPSEPTVPTPEPHETEPVPPIGTPPPDGSGWRQVEGFPGGGALRVSAVAGTEGGFVAVGAEPAAGEEPDGVRQGLIWTSSDGLAWLRVADPAFHGASLDGIAELDGSLYVFGFYSLCPAFDDDCPDTADTGNAAWRGSVAGGWERLVLPATLRDAVIDGVTAAAGQLVAYGTYGDDVTQAIWSSGDGERWDETTDMGDMDYVAAVVTAPAGMAALGTHYDFEADIIEARAAFSADGRSFGEASVPSGVFAAIEGVADGPAGLLAVGNVVPADEPDSGAAVLASSDGREWTSRPADAFANASVWAAFGLDGGYLVIGSQVAPGSEGRSVGRAWQSADGVGWRALPGFDAVPFSEVTGAAITGRGVIVFTVDLSDEEPVVRAWFTGPEVYSR